MKYIGVIDCNNFFVSCERLFRPDLVGKPVIVLSANDGCVVARSQEVKDMGVLMGAPVFQIKDIIKDMRIVMFSSHFALYRDISSRVFAVAKSLLSTMEIYSIDEAFFTIVADSKEALEIELKQIKLEVERLVGIPVSLGASASKTQAKYANRLAKKAGGVVVLDSGDWSKLSPKVLLREIWGVGGRLERRYKEASLSTVKDLVDCPRLRLDSLFGVNGLRLQSELSGTPVYDVVNIDAAQQSITSSRSFEKNVTELAVIKDAVAYHVRQVVTDLRKLRLKTKHIIVSLGTSRFGDYLLRGGSLAQENATPTDDVMLLLKQALALVDSLYEPGVPYKKAGVYIGQFTPREVTQASLFSESEKKQTESISTLLDDLNAQYGVDFITVGKQTKDKLWQAKSEQKSPAYTTRWNDLVVAKA